MPTDSLITRTVIIAVVGISQSCGTQLSKAAFTHGLNAPFALSWLTCTAGIVMGIPWVFSAPAATPSPRAVATDDAAAAEPCDEPQSLLNAAGGEVPVSPTAAGRSPSDRTNVALPSTVVVCGFYGLYLAANLSYQIALAHEDAAIVAAVFSAAPAFVCALSWLMLPRSTATGRRRAAEDGDDTFILLESGASLSWLRRAAHRVASVPWATDSLATGLAVTGIVLSVHPWTVAGARTGGYSGLAAASPVAAAFYKVLFAKCFPSAGPSWVGGFLAKLAVINVVIGSSLVAFFYHVVFAESDAARRMLVPSGSEWAQVPWGLVASVCLASMIFNGAVNYGVTVMPPLFVSVGTLLATALNIGYEGVTTGVMPSAAEWGGVSLICSSLVMLMAAASLQQAA